MITGFIINAVRRPLGLVVTCCMIAAGSGAHADPSEDVLFSQVMDPDVIVNGYISNGTQNIAQRFILSDQASIGVIELLAFYMVNEPFEFTVSFLWDDNGMPGAVIEDAVLVSTEKAYLIQLFGYPLYRQSISIAPVELAAGSYWIQVGHNRTLNSGQVWAWGGAGGGLFPGATSSGSSWTLGSAYFSLTLKKAAPKVASIRRLLPVAEHTNEDALVFQVSFDTEVTGVDAGDFVVSGVVASVTSVAMVSQSVYNVTVSGGVLSSHNGTVSLSLGDDHGITDLTGEPLVGTTPLEVPQTYIVDNEAPRVVISPPDTTSTKNGSAGWSVTIEGADIVDFSVHHIQLVHTGTAKTSSYSFASGDPRKVTILHISGVGTVSFSLPAGLAKDLAGNQSAAVTSERVIVGDVIRDIAGNFLQVGSPIDVYEGYTIVFNQAPFAPALLAPVSYDGDPWSTGRTLSLQPVLIWEVPEDEDDDALHFIVQIDTGSGLETVADSAVDPTGFTLFSNPNVDFPAASGAGMVAYRIQPDDGVEGPGVYSWTVIAHHGDSTSMPAVTRTIQIGERPVDLESAVAGDYRIRLSFLQALRREVNFTRLFYGEDAVDFTDSAVVPNESLVRSVHVNELREALDELPLLWGLTPNYSQGINAHSSFIKAGDFIEIRNVLEGHQANGDDVQ